MSLANRVPELKPSKVGRPRVEHDQDNGRFGVNAKSRGLLLLWQVGCYFETEEPLAVAEGALLSAVKADTWHSLKYGRSDVSNNISLGREPPDSQDGVSHFSKVRKWCQDLHIILTTISRH